MLVKILRWILVLPGGVFAGVVSIFILHFVLYIFLSKFFSTYPEFPERAFTPFAFAVAFIIVGSTIAPYYKIATALILFLIWITLAAIFAAIHFKGIRWFGKDTYLEADGLAMAFGIIGAILGLFVVKDGLRNQAVNIYNAEDDKEKSKTLKDRRIQDISDIVFFSLFILCAFNDLSRNIFFGIYLTFILLASSWTIKKKLYKTSIQLFELTKGLIMAISLIIGLVYNAVGIYVSILCAVLCALPFILRTIQDIRHTQAMEVSS